MKLLLNTVVALLMLAMIAVIPLALTGTLPLGINTGHPPVNGAAVVWETVNRPAAPMPEISEKTIGTAAAGELPGIGVVNTIGNADIAHKIGAK